MGNALSKQTSVSVWAITSLRFLITSTIVAFITRREIGKLFSKENLKLHMLSVLFLLRSAAIVTGFQLTAFAKPLAIVLTWPIMFALLSVAFLGTKLNFICSASLALSAVGMFCILGDPLLLAPGENFLGYGLMFVGAIITASEMVLNRRAIDKQGAIKVLFYSTFLAGLITVPTLGSFMDEFGTRSGSIGLLICALYIIGTFVFYLALEDSTPISTAVFSYLEVPSNALIALYFFNEDFSVRSVTGIVLILTGALLVSTEQARTDRRASSLRSHGS